MNNVVGKMLIVMQLVFSVLFMCFAGAVYTFQGQWRTKALDLQLVVDDQSKQIDDGKATRDREVMDITAKYEKANTNWETVRAELQNAEAQAATDQALLAAASLERDKALADSEVASAEAAARVVEANTLNKEVRSQQLRISALVADIQSVENDLLDKTGKLASAVEIEEQHLSELGRMKDLLRLNDIDPGQLVVGPVPGQVEKVDGKVRGTRRNKARTAELVEITIGSDDSVYVNQQLTVFRKDKYICTVRIVEVFPDVAICLVIEKTRQGIIQEGDNVTTKL
ncbi:MAG: hypothetical protein GY758_25845 [Fuerstiella sp.]|nr:hypothetical protein [Fuerstiella sp.]MCP4785220.1 hypothetical protein [Fuerstiella sp.]MCP4853031.1 hypothetical protein [Fuerstiella sp.]